MWYGFLVLIGLAVTFSFAMMVVWMDRLGLYVRLPFAFFRGERGSAISKHDYLVWLLSALLASLITAFAISIPLRNQSDFKSIVTIWAGLGTAALAILTAAYVLTTSRQLGAMRD